MGKDGMVTTTSGCRDAAILCIILLVLLCAGCAPVSRAGHVVEHACLSEIPPAEYGDTFDWQNKSPLDFLELLTAREPEKTYMVHGIHRDWIKRSDIPGLMALLDSTEPCASVTSTISSYRDFGGSNVGNEAAFLVRGFRENRYPAALNSTRPEATPRDKDELRRWWATVKD